MAKLDVMVRVIYPEDMLVPVKQVRLWYADSVANGDIYQDDAGLDWANAPIEDIILALNNFGNFSFPKDWDK